MHSSLVSRASACVPKTAVFVGPVALLLAGCAGMPKVQQTAQADPGAKIVLSPDQYEYVTVTGSAIPVLKPKGQPLDTVAADTPELKTLSPEDLRDAVRRGQSSGGVIHH